MDNEIAARLDNADIYAANYLHKGRWCDPADVYEHEPREMWEMEAAGLLQEFVDDVALETGSGHVFWPVSTRNSWPNTTNVWDEPVSAGYSDSPPEF